MAEDDIIECADCGAILKSNELSHENDEGEPICGDCAESYVACDDCGETVNRNSEYRNEGNAPICESCGEHYSVCGDCGTTVHEDNGTWIAGAEIIVCSSCFDNHYYRCEDCGRYVSEDESNGLGSGGRICQTCYERNDYSRCCDCGDLYNSYGLHFEDDEEYCSDCYRVRQQGESTTYSV